MQTFQLNKPINSLKKQPDIKNLDKSCISWRDIQGLTWLLVDDYWKSPRTGFKNSL